MQAHTNETPPPRHLPQDAEADVTPVGTFAEGQSMQGTFAVVIGAEVGTFATGQADDETLEAV